MGTDKIGEFSIMDLQFKAKKSKQIKESFWNYFLDHACVCNDKMCVCHASTFQDMLPELSKFDEDPRIKEILNR